MKLPPSAAPATHLASGSFGRKVLESMGWASGKGLGKHEDGMCDALAPKRKDDTAGIGGNQRFPWQEKVWEKSFDAALAQLAGDSDGGESGSGDASPDSSDSEEAARRGGAAAPTETAIGRDGIIVTATRAELSLAKELAKDPWGRFGGRDGKMARIARAEAAAAAASGRPALAPSYKAAPAAADPCMKRVKRKRAPSPSPEPAEPPPPPPPPGWWSAIFHYAGAMVGAEKAVVKERGFCEADQEALFKESTEAAATGRVGLGRRSGTNALQIAGGKWAGNKVTFGGGADASDEEAEEAEEAEAEEVAAAGRLKWRKLATGALAAAPKGRLSERKLRAATLAAAAVKLGWPEGHSALAPAFEAAAPLASKRFSRLPCGRLALADTAAT